MKRPPNPFLAVIFVLAFSALGFSSAANVYITPDGSSQGACTTSPQNPAWFNNAANWGSGATQIGPGDTVHLCGTFTAATNGNLLYVQSSGTSGSPITIVFEPGAILQAPYFSDNGAIYISGKSYIVIDGGTNGIIQNTNNCTTCTYHTYVSSGMYIGSGNNIEVKNLTCQNIYVRTSTTDHNMAGGPSQNNCIHFDGGSNLTVHDSVFHDAGWTIWYGAQSGAASNFTAYNNELYRTDHGIGFGEGGATGKTFSGILIYNNHFHDPGNWDDTASPSGQWYHHDGIHLFWYCSGGTSCSQTSSSNINIYNNLFDGNWGQVVGGQEVGMSSFVFMEGQQTGLNFFNNGGIANVYANNGLFNLNAANEQIYNNTVIGNTTSDGYCLIANDEGGTSYIKNNVLTGCQGLINPQSGNFSGGIDHNVYGAGGNQMFQWHNGSAATNIATWRTQCGCDANAKVANPPGLDSTGHPSDGSSAVIGAGANLTSVGIAALDADKAGLPRPSSGSWDAGSYGYSTSNPPAAPSGLTATMH